MPFNYKSPGVYVEEPQTGARPIESAGTSMLGMVGLCAETIELQEIGKDDHPESHTPDADSDHELDRVYRYLWRF